MPEPAEERPTSEIVHCPRCGAAFLAEVCPEGLCPRCLLKQGLEEFPDTDEEEPQKDGSKNGNSELVPGQVFGPYRILGLLGEGGMGRVYLAEQEHPVRRQVALKVIKLGIDTREVLARFDTERQALAMMDHPNIAKVLDAGASELGRPYFVMEYEPGIPITEYCDKNRLSNRERLELLLPVCLAVHHAHQKGIIHRDLKASNILITLQDGRPVPKVIDFGVAKATDQRLAEKTAFTQFGSIVGTPEYMSPEQARTDGLDIDTRTDIYSLGVLLYELLVGVLPFDSKALRKAGYDEIRRIIREEEPPKPTTRLHTLSASAAGIAALRRTDVKSLARQLRGDLDWIVMKALEKDRARRYASASELAADLQRHLRDEPVVASPPSAVYRARKFLRRHRMAAMATAALAALLVSGIAATKHEAAVAREERARAEAHARTVEREKVRTEAQRRTAEEQRLRAERFAAQAVRERANAERRLEALERVAGSAARVYASTTQSYDDDATVALIAEHARDSLLLLDREGRLEPQMAPLIDSAVAAIESHRLAAKPSSQRPAGWFFSEEITDEYSVSTESKIVHGGKRSLFLRSLVPAPRGSVTVRQRFKAAAFQGSRVRLSAFLRLEKLTNFVDLRLVIDLEDPARSESARERLWGTTPWERHGVVVDVPDSARYIEIQMQMTGPGALWADDFSFEKVAHSIPLTEPDGPENLNFVRGRTH